MPALLTSTAMGPISRSIRSTPAATAAGSTTSNAIGVDPVSLGREGGPALLEPPRVAGVEHDLGAGAGQGAGERESDALAGAGDERDAPRQVEELQRILPG